MSPRVHYIFKVALNPTSSLTQGNVRNRYEVSTFRAPRSFFHLHRPHFVKARNTLDSSPNLVYQRQEGVENLENYCRGGYYPVHLWDRYCNGRYEVLHKLGYGTHSTVWLAKDHVDLKYVAFKILMASSSKKGNESKIMGTLNQDQNAQKSGILAYSVKHVRLSRSKRCPPLHRDRCRQHESEILG